VGAWRVAAAREAAAAAAAGVPRADDDDASCACLRNAKIAETANARTRNAYARFTG
jgi:hypothetical protein